MKFSQELAADSPFRAREFIAGTDAVTLATDILALDHDAFSAALRKSPMKRVKRVKRAKLAGLGRNTTAVLTNTPNADERPVRHHIATRDRAAE